MAVYLLDTNIISDQWDPTREHHKNIMSFFNNCTESDYICTTYIAVAEILYGYEVVLNPDLNRKKIIENGIMTYSKIFPIDKHTIEPWAKIRSCFFMKYGTVSEGKKGRRKIRERQPEEIIDVTSGKSMGIQENDLWMIAIAVEHEMTFVTNDGKMKRLLEVAKEIYPAFDSVSTIGSPEKVFFMLILFFRFVMFPWLFCINHIILPIAINLSPNAYDLIHQANIFLQKMAQKSRF